MRNSLVNFDVRYPGRYLGTRVVHSVASVGGALIIDVYYYDSIIVRNAAPTDGKEKYAMVYCNGYHAESIRRFINSALEQLGYTTRIELVPNTNRWIAFDNPFVEGMLIHV